MVRQPEYIWPYVGRSVALVLKGNNVTMNAFCIVIDDMSKEEESYMRANSGVLV
jgi:hypothetical protein